MDTAYKIGIYLGGAIACYLAFRIIAYFDSRRIKKPGSYGNGPWH